MNVSRSKMSTLILTAAIGTQLAVAAVSNVAFSAEDMMYVQATKVDLKDGPKMDAKKVTELKRGDALKVLQKQDLWFQVGIAGKQGWVSKMFVSAHKPVGAADLNKDVQGSLEKASRKRSNSFAVSASTRGLTASSRIREGRELYQSDFQALGEIERYSVAEDQLDKFRSSAKLNR